MTRAPEHGLQLRPRLLNLPTDPSHAAHLRLHGPLPPVPTAAAGGLGPLAELVGAAGLRGRGGAWFPTERKWQAVARNASRRRPPVVVGNGMEGEPASDKDELLLSHSPHLVLDGLVLAARTLGADAAYLAVDDASCALTGLREAIAQRSADDIGIELVTPPARYVASEETALLRFLAGGPAIPTAGTTRPNERGLRGRPTLVQNVETLAQVALIARYGPDWFRSEGDPDAPGTALVTVTGAGWHRQVAEVATGTRVRDVLGDGCTSAPVAVLAGGYGGSWLPLPDAMDAPWSPAGLAPLGAVVGAGVLAVLDRGSCPVVETSRVASWMARQSAGQCGPCTHGLPAVADDLRLISEYRARGSDVERLTGRLGLVAGRGACRHPDGVARLVASLLRAHGDEIERHLAGQCSAGGPHRSLPVLPVPSGEGRVA